MTRPLALALWIFLVLSAATVWSAERYPPPDFTDHKLPVTQFQKPHEGPGTDVVPIVALVLALGVATWCAIGKEDRKKRRRGRSRAGLVILAIASLLYFGFIREGCICAIGAIQNVSLGLVDPSYTIPIVAIVFFLLPIGVALFFGRTFCAGVCPLGALQELVLLRPVRVPKVVDHVLGLVPFFYLGLGVALAASGTAFLICRYDPFVGIFRMAAPLGMLVFGVSLLLIGLFVGRPYCRYLCPYGALLEIVSRFAKWRVKVSPSECVQCRLCEDSCPYGAIQEPTVDRPHDQLQNDRRRLIWVLAAFPVLLGVCTFLGYGSTPLFAQLDPVIRTAQLVHENELKKKDVSGKTGQESKEKLNAKRLSTLDRPEFVREDTLRAFEETSMPVNTLYESADEQWDRLTIACTLLGAWVGLVIGVKLIRLSIRRRRTDYSPNPITCVACGRCFRDCPVEREGEEA